MKYPNLTQQDKDNLRVYCDYLGFHLVLNDYSAYIVRFQNKGYIQKSFIGKLYLEYVDGQTRDIHDEIKVVLRLVEQNKGKGIVGELFPNYVINEHSAIMAVANPLDMTMTFVQKSY